MWSFDTDADAMETPTTVPGSTAPAADPRATPATRGMLGLPVRLALLTVAAIAVFTAGLVGYADHRLDRSRDEQATDAALEVARTTASQLTEADFVERDDAFRDLLQERAAQLRGRDGEIRRIVVYARDSAAELDERAASPGPAGDGGEQLARRALASGEEEVQHARDHISVAWPLAFSDGSAGAVVLVELPTDALYAGAGATSVQLTLAGIAGGSLLAATLLLLLRRELFRPLEELRRAMAQIRGGARGVRIGWSRRDELGLVAAEFDSMVHELEAAQAELARYVTTDPLTGLLTRDAFRDRCSAEFTRARREGYPIAMLAIDVDDLQEINRTHDRAAGDQVLGTIGAVIGGCTRPTDACGRTGGDSFHVALVGADAAQAGVVIARIREEIGRRVGIGPQRTRVTCSFGLAEYPRHAADQLALERMAVGACVHAQRDGRDRAVAFGPAGGYVDAMSLVPEEQRPDQQPTGARELSSTIHALARSLDGIDPVLGGGAHSQRVARYAAAVARDLGLSDGPMRELRSAAVLHDVGKVAVPPTILRTASAELDDRQRGALHYHAWVSRTMIAGAGLPAVANIVFHVPERWDGTGYPERLREEQIPLASRILRAAELLDDLTSRGHRREPMTPFAAASELKRRAGSELDPDVAVRLARLVRDEALVGNEPVEHVGPDADDTIAA